MTPTNLEELKRASEALMQSRANGDPEKYAALLSVAEAHRIGRSVLSLISELEAERERNEWRPIESAPKDGTWIVAWRGAAVSGTWESLVTVRWHQWEDGGAWVWPEYQYEVYSDKGRAEADRQIDAADYYEDSKNFTHWRPLPEPPARAHFQSQETRDGADRDAS